MLPMALINYFLAESGCGKSSFTKLLITHLRPGTIHEPIKTNFKKPISQD
jgi:ABC-type ATPase involved in cell division